MPGEVGDADGSRLGDAASRCVRKGALPRPLPPANYARRGENSSAERASHCAREGPHPASLRLVHPLPQAGEGINFSCALASVSLRPQEAPPPTPPRANYARRGENSTAHRGLGTSSSLSPAVSQRDASLSEAASPSREPVWSALEPMQFIPSPACGRGCGSQAAGEGPRPSHRTIRSARPFPLFPIPYSLFPIPYSLPAPTGTATPASARAAGPRLPAW
jgi:hypothetical protein